MSTFLLTADEQGIVVFHIWKSLKYSTRIQVSLALIAVGLIWQIINLGVFPGVLFILAGNFLLLVRGYHNQVDFGKYNPRANWEKVAPNTLDHLEVLHKKIKRWDKNALDYTNGIGGFLLVVIFAISSVLIIGGYIFGQPVMPILGYNILALLIPHWVTGTRTILTKPKLISKVDYFKDVISTMQTRLAPYDVEYFMLLKSPAAGPEDGPPPELQIPEDIKIRIKFPKQHRDFLGYYAQIVLNTVQGHSYPYFYVVLVAKDSFGLEDVAASYTPPSKIIKEFSYQGDVEVLVIRQQTTKTSGYHTAKARMLEIFEEGLQLSENVAAGR